MIQKQTVYLPVKIDDEFWTKWDNGEKPDYDLAHVETGENIESWVNEKEGYFFTPEQVNEYTQNVIKQSLETAAEKVKKEITEIDGCDDHTPYMGACGTCGYYPMPKIHVVHVDKESILNVVEEVYGKLQV